MNQGFYPSARLTWGLGVGPCGGTGGAREEVQQHPWPRPSRCSQGPPGRAPTQPRPLTPGAARVLPADADMERAGLACSVLADLALAADACLPLGPAWVGTSCRAERCSQEEHLCWWQAGAEGEDGAACLAPEGEGKAPVLMGDQAPWSSSPGAAGLGAQRVTWGGRRGRRVCAFCSKS